MALSRIAALAAGLALAGCYDFASYVSTIPEDARLAASPFADGLYCAVRDWERDRADGVAYVEVDDECFSVRFDAETRVFVLDMPDEDEGPAFAIGAALGRGGLLFELPPSEDGRRDLGLVVASEDAFAILPPPVLTGSLVDAAAADGVALDVPDNFDPDAVDYADDDPATLRIVSGAPEAVLGLVRDAAGLTFDAALREPALGRRLLDGADFYVRVDALPESAPPDLEAARAQVEAVRTRIGRAMTLE